MQGYLQGDQPTIAHRYTKNKQVVLAVDTEDGTMIFVVVKPNGDVGLMAIDTDAAQVVEDLHLVGRYSKAGDYEVESLGLMHLEPGFIHQLIEGADLDVVYEEDDDED
jgi:hypothetical protein